MNLIDSTVDAFSWLDEIGTVAFAVSGAMVAVRARMDWLGVCVLAVVTAIGGGTLRDVLIGHLPVSWVEDPAPVVVALITAVVVIVGATTRPQSRPDSWRIVVIADAAGLAVFTTTGTQIALAEGVLPGVAALMGVITGVVGGVLRDVLARQQPMLLVGQIYALAAAAGAVWLLVADQLALDPDLTRWGAIGVILTLRLLAVRFSWSLPRFEDARG